MDAIGSTIALHLWLFTSAFGLRFISDRIERLMLGGR
jgi:hypothetical protein